MSLISRRIDRQIDTYQRELIDTHYAEVETMYKQIRGWRHDYRNHIQTMKAYAAEGDMDAILNSKISLARSRDIPVVADAHIPLQLTTPELDLCVIIGNLFDNAIEASLKLPEEERMIRVYMDMKETQLYISFTNFTADKKMQKVGQIFRTTKGEGHGFALVRIDAIIERNLGYISRNSEDGAFTTEILLPQVMTGGTA